VNASKGAGRLISYFKKQRRDRIRFLLRPKLARNRGCLYFFLKCWLVILAISLSSYSLFFFQYLNGKVDNNLGMALVIGTLVPMMCFAVMLAIDFLEWIWCRKPDHDEKAATLNLRHLLEIHAARTEAVGFGDHHRIKYFLSEPGDIESRLAQYSYRQLMTIEDAILYNDEVQGIMNGFSYGYRVMVGLMFVFGFVAFAGLYQFLEEWIFDIFGRQRGGILMLFLFVPIGCFAVWVATARSLYYWNMIGAMWRSYARVAIYYWPITLGLLITLRKLYDTYQAISTF